MSHGFINFRQAAKLLRCTSATLYALLEARVIPGGQLAGAWVIPDGPLQAWLDQQPEDWRARPVESLQTSAQLAPADPWASTHYFTYARKAIRFTRRPKRTK